MTVHPLYLYLLAAVGMICATVLMICHIEVPTFLPATIVAATTGGAALTDPNRPTTQSNEGS